MPTNAVSDSIKSYHTYYSLRRLANGVKGCSDRLGAVRTIADDVLYDYTKNR